MSDFLIR